MKKIFDVKGMHCRSCEMLLKNSLEETKGVKKVDISYKSGKLMVLFDGNFVDDKKLRNVVEREGYKVL
ncbi:MAG: heavy-metal-associated domain-containing protein [Candidatus Woesearchaeota archaeon]